MVKFKGEKKREIFIGSLRCEVNETTEKALHDHIVVNSKLRNDGIWILRYGNGQIEIKTVHEVATEMCKEIYEKDGKKYPFLSRLPAKYR